MAEFMASLFSVSNILYNFIGVFIGIVFGAIPGLTATLGIALFLPFTFGLPATTSFALLLGIYCGGIYGGSITAILIKTPGTPSSATTVLDGHPMRNNGMAMEALSTAAIASFVGGIFSCACLIFLAPQLAKVALKFGAPEYFAIGLFGLSIISALSGKNIWKGLLSASLGMAIATIGQDPISGASRYTFGVPALVGGFNIVAALIGIFAISEVLTKLENSRREALKDDDVSAITGHMIGIRHLFKTNWLNMLRSSIIGTVIGIIPATGSATAAWISYNEARRGSKYPEKFGTGIPDGVVASEAANNAVTGGALIPLLTLGIPGDACTAILMGALMLQGLTPGPTLFTDHGDVMNGIYCMLLIANVFMLVLGLLGVPMFVQIIKAPTSILMSVVLVLCFIGSYAINSSIWDVRMALILGVVGFLFNKGGFPLSPFLLGFILEPMIEKNFLRALVISSGKLSIFVTHPISLAFLLIAVVTFVTPLIRQTMERHRQKK